jgi:hypothetical protein
MAAEEIERHKPNTLTLQNGDNASICHQMAALRCQQRPCLFLHRQAERCQRWGVVCRQQPYAKVGDAAPAQVELCEAWTVPRESLKGLVADRAAAAKGQASQAVAASTDERKHAARCNHAATMEHLLVRGEQMSAGEGSSWNW